MFGMRLNALGLLGVVFVTLKLIHYIDWSWWLVLAPFWAGPVVLLVFEAIAAMMAFAFTFLED
jgi:hypothetical protein